MASVSLKNLNKRYNGAGYAVKAVDLDIPDKEFLVIVGPSGCGKTSILRMIAGLEDITEGDIYIGGKKVNDLAPQNRDIAMVFQNYALYPHMNVFENMAFGLQLRKIPKSEIQSRVEDVSRMLEIDALLKRKPKELSGGQRQRVAMGRAIVRQPKVFLMDEPLSNLDAQFRVQMRAELQKLHRRLGITVVYVTHDQTEAMTLGTRIAVLKNGMIQQVDAPLALYENPSNSFVAGFIGSPSMNFLPATVVSKETGMFLQFKTFQLGVPRDREPALLHYKDKEILFGIRPEHFHEQANSGSSLDVTVEAVEQLGSETLIHFTLEGAPMVAKANPEHSFTVGQTCRLTPDMMRMHAFERETEKTIC